MRKLTAALLAVASMSVVWHPALAGDLSIIYLDPDSPETSMYRVEEWPSFIFMAGAPLKVAYLQASAGRGPSVSHERPSTRSLVGPRGYAGYPAYFGVDMDCPSFANPVAVGFGDPHRLDADNDGIGCE